MEQTNIKQTAAEKTIHREFLFDNYKAFLIVLVVIGHFIEPCYENNGFLYDLKWAIVSFHMPAFIFISGYFSKKGTSFKKLLNGLVIPYFVYEIIYYLLYTLILDKETKLYFAHPKFSLWYLMALFAWKLLAPMVEKIPGHLVLSLLAGLYIGFTHYDNFLSIPRIIFFFPFFLAGLHFDSSWLRKHRTKENQLLAIGILGLFLFLLFTGTLHNQLDPKIFYGRYSYTDLGQGNLEGILIRIVCYSISFLLIYLFLLLIPTKETSYSYLGERTMAIYIFHGLAYSCFKYGSRLLSLVNTNLESILLIGFCLFLVWLLSTKPFVTITNKIAHLL